MRISQLSKETGASARSIRHYEKKKLLTARRLDNDYREFDEADVKRIQTIQIYLELGMSTKDILEILKCHDNYNAYDINEFCEEMLGVYEEKHVEIVQQIKTMTIVQQKLEQRIEQMKAKKTMLSTAIDYAEHSSKTL